MSDHNEYDLYFDLCGEWTRERADRVSKFLEETYVPSMNDGDYGLTFLDDRGIESWENIIEDIRWLSSRDEMEDVAIRAYWGTQYGEHGAVFAINGKVECLKGWVVYEPSTLLPEYNKVTMP